MKQFIISLLLGSFFFMACSSSLPKKTVKASVFYRGADLSYVNEMEDCGAIYKNRNGVVEDPFRIFKDAGTNLIRVRKWHNPDWTSYSDYKDVMKTIKRAKALNMKVLLDFHYSDDWADPQKQKIPKAWLPSIHNLEVLGDSVYNYTYTTLKKLHTKNLLPELVQVGNETNIMILQATDSITKMDWSRNAFLINKGIQAVRDVAKETNNSIEIMLHIAQPENGLWWFKEAKKQGITDYDWIGLSYYPKWSKYNLKEVSKAFTTLISTFNKKLMVVETAYPFSLKNQDKAGNILGEDALIDGYSASQKGQLAYLSALKKAIQEAGGLGLVYWEPAWVTNNCQTRWGKGSHWENATLFDENATPTLGLDFLKSEE